MQTIENSLLQVSVDENGAQLAHVISKQGDFDYFDNEEKQEKAVAVFKAADNDENLALTLPWTVVDKGDARVSLTLIDTANSYKKFPYHFEIMLTYSIEANQMKIAFHLKNNSNKEMPFSLDYNLPLSSNVAEESVNRIALEDADKKVILESADFKISSAQDEISCAINQATLAPETSQDVELNFVFE